jgi:hypothetical protein
VFIGMISQVRFCLQYVDFLFHSSLLHTHIHTLDIYLILDNFPHCLNNDLAEMRKQRKMGHVTIVGPSMGAVEERLKSMLKEEGFDCQSAGNRTRVSSYLFTVCHDAG